MNGCMSWCRTRLRAAGWKAAKEYGVDLTLNLRSLTRTPDERVREMEATLRFAEELHRAAAHLDR